MEQLTGKPKEEIIKDLQGVIFRIPASEPAQYVTADEYLSGNVRAKLITAEAAAKENPEFAVNAQALRQVIPQDLSAAEISGRLGTDVYKRQVIFEYAGQDTAVVHLSANEGEAIELSLIHI